MMKTTQVAVFRLKDFLCGMETAHIHTIIKYQEPDAIEGMPGYAEGIIRWRDVPIPVVNLVSRLDLEKSGITKKTKILITEIWGRLIGFTVDDVNIIMEFSPENIEPAPPVLTRLETGYLKAVGKSEGRLVPLLDVEKLLTRPEMEQLEHFKH